MKLFVTGAFGNNGTATVWVKVRLPKTVRFSVTLLLLSEIRADTLSG